MAWKLFPDGRRGLGRQGSKVVTALNDTLFFFGLLFSTEKPRGIGDYSSTKGAEVPCGLALERR